MAAETEILKEELSDELQEARHVRDFYARECPGWIEFPSDFEMAYIGCDLPHGHEGHHRSQRDAELVTKRSPWYCLEWADPTAEHQ